MHRSRTRRLGVGITALLAVTALSTSLSVTMGSAPAAAATATTAPPASLVKLIPSPRAPKAQAPGTFTGDAGEWAVGLVVGGSDAVVYLCDGKHAGQWFGAKVSGTRLTGTAPNGSLVSATLASGVWSGTVTMQGKPVAFRAEAATKQNTNGIWRAKPSPFDNGDYVVGWISTSKGVRGVSQTATGTVANGLVIVNGPTPTINGSLVPPTSVPVTTSPQARKVTLPPASTTPPPVPNMSALCTSLANSFNFSQSVLADGNATQKQKDAAQTVSDNSLNGWYAGSPSCRDTYGLIPIY